MSIFATAAPSYADVLEVRAGCAALVRDFLATCQVAKPQAPATAMAESSRLLAAGKLGRSKSSM
jgi:hypothetical protein